MQNYVDPLPGVPRVESPFFREFFDEGDPDYAVARQLHDDGFAVFDFPIDGFDELADRLRATLEPQFDLALWHGSDGNVRDRDIWRVQDAWRFNDDVRRIATDAAVLALLSKLYGREVFPFQTLNFPIGTEQHFHTDSIHFSALPERFMCGVWVALEDIDEDQGPLLYYPGSHKWPIYRNEHIARTHLPGHKVHQSTFEPLWERLVEIHGVEPVRFRPRKGQALIWAANLLHGGDAHRNRQTTRWSQVTHYLFKDCLYYTPLASNETIGELHVRQPMNILTGQREMPTFHGQPAPQLVRTEVRDVPTFDPAGYLEHNPDVAQSGVDPYRHYAIYGVREGRRWY